MRTKRSKEELFNAVQLGYSNAQLKQMGFGNGIVSVWYQMARRKYFK